ncbi:hypothetical protein FQN53_002971 [Emmonsiellopsis sp. PD_33]|nr:hypothetical protein FQN53_002971 [Emmonsiellopsis sp. PD_33]
MALTPNHAAKRRRIEQATSTLSKPFKSPLRKPVSVPASASTVDTEGNFTSDKLPIKASPITPSSPVTDPTYSPLRKPTPHIPSPLKRTSTNTTKSTPSSPTPPQLLALQKQHTALLAQLSQLRSELDTLTQAVKIEQSGQDAELEVLIGKWKAASREAADELFVAAEEMERRRAEVEDGVEKGGNDGVKDGEGDEEESFMMDMMLKSLNIELDLIGFDKLSQQWV